MSRHDRMSDAWRAHFDGRPARRPEGVVTQGPAGGAHRDAALSLAESSPALPDAGWVPRADEGAGHGPGGDIEARDAEARDIEARDVAARDIEEAGSGIVAERLARVGRAVSTFVGPLVIIDFLLGVAYLGAGYPVTPALPGYMAGTAAVIVVAMFRRKTLRVTGGGIMAAVAIFMLGYLIVVSIHMGQPWTQRILKFALFIILSAVLATGRINIRSFVIGLGAGAVVNAALYYAGLTPNNYPPYLSGFYLDKNVAGMYYAVWGALGLGIFRGRAMWLWFATSGGLCFLTGSRTALASYIGAVAWFTMRNRVGISYRVLLGALGMSILLWAVDNIAELQAFGDRTGTDWYRRQIEIAMQAKVDITPWYGLGLNEGQVVIGHRPQWFHDSYSQAFVEGGYLNLWVVVGVFVLLGIGLFDRRLHISRELLAAEGAIISVLVCAWKLGEALMTVPAFVVLGVAIAYRLGTPVERARDAEQLYAEAMERHGTSAPHPMLEEVAR